MIELDPVKYEVFLQRLRSLLEEGRVSLAMVIGSPAIVEGGEMMTSFYDGDGNAVLTAQGTLFHVLGSSDAILKTIEWYEDDPGINDGDQFFWGDPYIAGTHLYDQILVKPIFWEGRRIAWVGTMTHTSDIGGVPRSLATEIFHEGVMVHGLKVVEAGKLRHDHIRNIVDQSRDPELVGLDVMGRIASNNTIEQGYKAMVEKFSAEFIEAAQCKLREDTEIEVRSVLKKLPDGTWQQRVYWSNSERYEGEEVVHPFKVECRMTKKGDELSFDFTGSSPQNKDHANSTLCASRSHIFIALAAFLFWDVPWNAGLTEMVKYVFPEGSLVNCRHPAATGWAPFVGAMVTDVAMGCIARMLYAAGLYEFVNSSWNTVPGGGPNYYYYGQNQYGGIVGLCVYDLFGGGQGATTQRVGNNTGGIHQNAKSAISDVEWKETYWPFLYLAQRHCTDSGGYGKFRGGLGLETIQMVYGSKDLFCNYLPTLRGGEVRGFGLFGGYPSGNALGSHRLIKAAPDVPDKLKQGAYPVTHDDLGQRWGVLEKESPGFRIERNLGGFLVNLDEDDMLGYQYSHGGGYGDPLDRKPEAVLQDVKDEAIYPDTAAGIYGVVLDTESGEIDYEGTKRRREKIRKERLERGERLTPAIPQKQLVPGEKKTLRRIHEYLEIIEKNNGEKVIACIKCGHEFGPHTENYKKYALRWTKPVCDIKKCIDTEVITCYQEYICPGCGTLLQVDTLCPMLDDDKPVWDIHVEA